MSLSHRETRIVKGMLARGDRQHDIAAYFGVNAGRIAEVASGDCDYPNAQPSPEEELPPPGPYITKYALQSVVATLNESIQAIELAGSADSVDDMKAALQLAKEILEKKMESFDEA